MISPLQIRHFWMAFRPAWEAYAGRLGLDPRDRGTSESWRHAILAEECAGQSSLKAIDNTGYARVMLRLAVEAGDEHAISYWSQSGERKALHRIDALLEELNRLDGRNHYTRAYAEGIARTMKLARDRPLDELPAELLRKIEIALWRKKKRVERAMEEAPF